MPEDRLDRQLAFVLELDRAKRILRRNPLADGSRRENDAEHMWHLTLTALILAEHASEPVDLERVLTMLLVHDVVEIDAGDTFVYDEAAEADRAEREGAAADRIFGLLPADQSERLRALWEEFEARETPDARFAAACDRLLPILMNHAAEGGAWTSYGIEAGQVLARNAHIGEASPALWEVAKARITEATERGWLKP